MVDDGRLGPIEWAVAARAFPGQRVCGDHWVVFELGGGSGGLFGVIDGLGHGSDAAAAAVCAAEVVGRTRDEPLERVLGQCHLAMAATRGAAITVVRIDFDTDILQWAGVGNVTGNLLARTPGGMSTGISVRLSAGIVGYRMPDVLSVGRVPVRPGNLVVLATDGVADGFVDTPNFGAPAAGVAQDMLGRFAKDTDDALVLVARHRGLAP